MRRSASRAIAQNHQITSTARIAPSYSISIETWYWFSVCFTKLRTSWSLDVGVVRRGVLQRGLDTRGDLRFVEALLRET